MISSAMHAWYNTVNRSNELPFLDAEHFIINLLNLNWYTWKVIWRTWTRDVILVLLMVGVKDGRERKLIMPYTFQIPELISSLAKAKN